MSLINGIPNELMSDIICLLPPFQIYELREVSKSWKNFVIHCECLWPKHFVHGQSYFGVDHSCISIDYNDQCPTYNIGIKAAKNVCFQNLMVMLPDDLNAIEVICTQNYGQIFAEKCCVHLNTHSTELLQSNPNILNEIFHCGELEVIAYHAPFKHIIKNPSIIQLPYVDSFNFRNYYIVASLYPDEVLNFLFNTTVHRNRGVLEFRIRIEEIQNFGVEFLEIFLEKFINFKHPELLFETIVINCEDFGSTWRNLLCQKGLEYKGHIQQEQRNVPMEVDHNDEYDSAWKNGTFQKMRPDKWTLNMTFSYGTEWLFEVYHQ